MATRSDLPPLPAWAHLPGTTASADFGPLEAAKALVPERFPGPPAADHPAIRYGILLCDTGYHWEAHEVLEAVWMVAPHNSRDRFALRAIIQLANAGLKLRMGRPRAANRLLAEVGALLAEAEMPASSSSFAGMLNAAALRRDVDALIVTLKTSASPGAGPLVPKIPMQKNA